jgi:putative nucleotidyltransferase with HDIG domain
MSDEVRHRVRNLEGLPPFPAIASQIMMECQKSNVDARSIARLVECEPAVSGKVLQLANSPMFGASRPIVSINHAIVLLGLKSVSQMALTIAAGTIFEGGAPNLSQHRKQTFRQSLACAITARALATEIDSVIPDEAFLCGVMHDVGKLVLFEVAAEPFCQMLESNPGGNTIAQEQATFGVDHAEIGKQCGAKWGFPSQINLAIADHHKNLSEIDDALSLAVMAGNYYSQRWSLTGNSEIIQPEMPEIDAAFSLSNLAELKEKCLDQYATVIEICDA